MRPPFLVTRPRLRPCQKREDVVGRLEANARPWACGPKPKLAAHDGALFARVMSEHGATLAELQAWLRTEHNMKVCIGCVIAVTARSRGPRPRRGQPGVRSANRQSDLFGSGQLSDGFRYRADFLDAAQEQSLLDQIKSLPFQEFEFHGFVGKRRVVSFGWRYDFNGGGLSKTEDIPQFLLPVRERAAAFAQLDAALQQVLVTEYGPGAAIGWHRDRSDFGEVVGISLLSSCTFRLRRKQGGRWQRTNLTVEPRSPLFAAWPVQD
jgi:alkylated DNA repair dioxygenase AlkB